MLSEIRDHATGWIAYIIVGIIIIPFAFWGVNEYFSGGEDVVVASVGGSEIQQTEYRRALDRQRAQMRQILGENFQPEFANSPEFKRSVIEDLIARMLLDRHAEDQGYRVGDELLARQIQANPRFQIDGRFSSDVYRGVVAQMGMTEPGFEASMRRQLVLDQVRDGIQDSAFVTPDQQSWLLELILQERRFDYAVLSAAQFLADVEVADEEIEEEYEANREQYRTPERLKIEYVELSVEDLASSISLAEEDIEQAYEQSKNRFSTSPVRRASHILIETGSDAGEEGRQAAEQKARELLEQLQAGADFAELAREHSDDPGSASSGGDLGRIEEGAMVPAFEDALFALEEEGALTGPVETRFGFHIIKLTEYEPASVKPLEEVRDQLAAEERNRQAEALFLDRAESFRNISFEQPQSLEPVATALDLEIQQSDWFTRNEGTGIAANPRVRQAAFDDVVYSEGLNSEAIELDINTLVAVRRLDVQPSRVRPLEDVRDQIEAHLKRSKAQDLVASLGPEIVERLESGTAWQAIIDEYGLSGETVTWSRAEQPRESGPHPAVVDEVFRLPAPAADAPVPGGMVLANGDFALFRLREVKEGDVEQASEDLVEYVVGSLQRRRGVDMVEQYLADLREQAEVSIREEAL
jgi:peptidyl-prolyl cis-trans isomerase D